MNSAWDQFPQRKLIGAKLDCSDVAVALNQAKSESMEPMEATVWQQKVADTLFTLSFLPHAVLPTRLGDIQLNQAFTNHDI